MGKFFKIAAIIVGALVVLVILTVVFITLFFDPNDFKGEVAKAIKEQTGRELEFVGDLNLSLFPWFGVKVGSLILSNPEGFSNKSFVEISGAKISAKIIPLFKKQLVMDKIILDGLRLSLERNKNGVTNWSDFAKNKFEETEGKTIQKEGGEEQYFKSFAIEGILLKDAHILWDDLQNNVHYELKNLNVTTGAFRPDSPIDFKISFEVAGEKPAITLKPIVQGTAVIDLKNSHHKIEAVTITITGIGDDLPAEELQAEITADIDANIAEQIIKVNNLKMTTSAQGGSMPVERVKSTLTMSIEADLANRTILVDGFTIKASAGGGTLPAQPIDAELTAKIEVNLARQTVTVSDMLFGWLDMKMEGNIKAEKIIEEPTYSGTIKISEFNPQQLLKNAGIKAPQTTDQKVLRKLAASMDFSGSPSSVHIEQLAMNIDDTNITGNATIKNFKNPRQTFSIAVDTIDIDRYLPPQSSETGDGSGRGDKNLEQNTSGNPESNLTSLRNLNIDGSVTCKNLKVIKAKMENVTVKIAAQDGMITIDPFQANLYEGSVVVKTSIDVREDIPRIAVNKTVKTVQVGPLLKDLTGEDKVTGIADIRADLSGAGLTTESLKQSLGGSIAFSCANGAVKGVNIAKMIRDAMATITGQPKGPDESLQTDFSELLGTAKIENGIVNNNDLLLKSPLLRVKGAGNVDLDSEKIDYLVTASIVGSLEGQGGASLDALKNIPVPIRITGLLSHPRYGLDIQALARELAKGELKEKASQLEDMIKEKIFGKPKQKEEGQQATKEPEQETGEPETKPEDLLKQQLEKGLQNLFN